MVGEPDWQLRISDPRSDEAGMATPLVLAFRLWKIFRQVNLDSNAGIQCNLLG